MAYRGAVIEQQWTPKEVKAYCAKKFESKLPSYLRNRKKKERPKRTVNSNGNLSKAQYMRFMEKGLSDEHILAKYQDLTPNAWKWRRSGGGWHKKTARQVPDCRNGFEL